MGVVVGGSNSIQMKSNREVSPDRLIKDWKKRGESGESR